MQIVIGLPNKWYEILHYKRIYCIILSQDVESWLHEQAQANKESALQNMTHTNVYL